MSLLPASTFEQAKKYKENSEYVSKLSKKFENAIERECATEIEAYKKAAEVLQQKLKRVSQTDTFKRQAQNLRNAEENANRALVQIERDVCKCINAIQKQDISVEEKKEKIKEVSDIVAQALMNQEDYAQLKKIQEQLSKVENTSRIVLLQ